MIKYLYPGARVLVILHEQSMRQFFQTWNKAKIIEMDLPETEDPTYKSYHSLLRHVFKWSREYMIWICEKLDLPDPRIESIPDSESIESRGCEYMEHLFERWRSQLTNIPKEKFFNPTFLTPWKVDYSIEAMLEHAVMHPIRHRFQLLELLDENLK